MRESWPELVITLCILFTLPVTLGTIPLVQFTHEEIDILVLSDRIDVTATYHYRNPYPFPVSQSFSVPFPADSHYPDPVGFFLLEVAPDTEQVATIFLWGKHRFTRLLDARSQMTLKLKYQQLAPKCSGTYLLTTTHGWRSPLKKGVYRLLPCGVRLTYSNYELKKDKCGWMTFSSLWIKSKNRSDSLATYDWSC